MQTRIYKLAIPSTGATSNALVQVIIQRDALLLGVFFGINVDSITDNAELTVELSTVSTGQTTTNDTQGPIASVTSRSNFVTSGLTFGQVNSYVGPIGLSLQDGDRLYINVAVAGTLAVAGNVYAYCQEK